MSDYKKMYYVMCDAASKALDKMELSVANAEAIKLLRTALREAEDIYIETCEQEENEPPEDKNE